MAKLTTEELVESGQIAFDDEGNEVAREVNDHILSYYNIEEGREDCNQ